MDYALPKECEQSSPLSLPHLVQVGESPPTVEVVVRDAVEHFAVGTIHVGEENRESSRFKVSGFSSLIKAQADRA